MHDDAVVFDYLLAPGTDEQILDVLWFDFTVGTGSIADLYLKRGARPLCNGDVIAIDGRPYRLIGARTWVKHDRRNHAHL
jgi:hypothetical protein